MFNHFKHFCFVYSSHDPIVTFCGHYKFIIGNVTDVLKFNCERGFLQLEVGVDASNRTNWALQVFIPLCASDMGERERATCSTALYTPFLDLAGKDWKGAETEWQPLFSKIK